MTGPPRARAAHPDARDDRGAVTIVLVATVLATVLLSTAVLAGIRRGVDALHVATAADSAAVAGAAAAVGLVPGPPCDAVSHVARAEGTDVERCDVDGATVTVRLRTVGPLVPTAATARAGPAAVARTMPGQHPGLTTQRRTRAAEAAGRVCMVCLSVRHPPTPTVLRAPLVARRPPAAFDQGVTCQARRSS